MERNILNITNQDRKTNIWVREKTKVTDVIEQVRRGDMTWARHVSRRRDSRWTLRFTTWKPYERKRPRRRPARRWRDELDDYWKGTIWLRIVRQIWKQHGEAFAQPSGHYGSTVMMTIENIIYIRIRLHIYVFTYIYI